MAGELYLEWRQLGDTVEIKQASNSEDNECFAYQL